MNDHPDSHADLRAKVEEERNEIRLEAVGGPDGLRDLMESATGNFPPEEVA